MRERQSFLAVPAASSSVQNSHKLPPSAEKAECLRKSAPTSRRSRSCTGGKAGANAGARDDSMNPKWIGNLCIMMNLPHHVGA